MTHDSIPIKTAYDEVPYESFPFPQSHPDRLGTMATLLGMSPAALPHCRVLELGCSRGGNLLPLAEQFPGSEFVGVDASGRQIADGQQVLDAAGLKNIRLLHKQIQDIDAQFGRFDYIIVHGVYSWVPHAVQDKILEISSRNLSANGVAYISYNTYPGWRMRGMIRDLMCYRASFFDRPEGRIREGRALLDFLAESVPTENNAYGILLRDELNLIRPKEDWYLLHEYLEEENRPEYFHDFMQRAQEKGLQYLGEADFSSMAASNFPPKVESMLRRLASDVIQMEQYMDFVRNRLFRQTLLCHQGVNLDRSIPAERVFGLHVASSAEPESGPIDVRSREQVTFRRPGSTLTTTEPLVKAAMVHLREVWPRTVPFQELLSAARGRLASGPMVIDAERAAQDARALAGPLIRCYATTHVDLSIQPTPCALEVSERPQAPRLARHQALAGNRVTNLWHESVRLSDLERHLLPHLNGNHDASALVDVMAQEVRCGRLVVHDAGRPVSQEDRIKQVLTQILDENLTSIARKGLLVEGGLSPGGD